MNEKTALHSAILSGYLLRTGESQREFAKKMRVTSATISYWTTGKLPIPIKRAVEIDRVTEGEISKEALYPDIFKGA